MFRINVIRNAEKQSKAANILFVVILTIALAISYSFVFQPRSLIPEIEDRILVTTSASYLIDNGDGTYSFYFNDAFVRDISGEELELPPHSNLPIITE